MVTISRYTLPEEAHLARCFLEGNGLEAWLWDENQVQMDWLISNAIGGVRLVVAEDDVETAMELLEKTRWDGKSFEIPRGGVPMALLSMIIGIPLFIFGRSEVRGDSGKDEDVAA